MPRLSRDSSSLVSSMSHSSQTSNRNLNTMRLLNRYCKNLKGKRSSLQGTSSQHSGNSQECKSPGPSQFARGRNTAKRSLFPNLKPSDEHSTSSISSEDSFKEDQFQKSESIVKESYDSSGKKESREP